MAQICYLCKDCSQKLGQLHTPSVINEVGRKSCYGCGDNEKALDVYDKEIIFPLVEKYNASLLKPEVVQYGESIKGKLVNTYHVVIQVTKIAKFETTIKAINDERARVMALMEAEDAYEVKLDWQNTHVEVTEQ